MYLAILIFGFFASTNSVPNTFTVLPVLSDTDMNAVFVTFQASTFEGRLWSFITPSTSILTVQELKLGAGSIGLDTCRKLSFLISNEFTRFGLTGCGFSPGSTYGFNAYIEALQAVDGGTVFQKEFTVPPDPSPLPFGPYCFDVDADYFGSTVEAVISDVEDAEACQARCQDSRLAFTSGTYTQCLWLGIGIAHAYLQLERHLLSAQVKVSSWGQSLVAHDL